MRITINNKPIEISEITISLEQLMVKQNVKNNGTAVAINNMIVKHDQWDDTLIKDGDSITVISAAFGG